MKRVEAGVSEGGRFAPDTSGREPQASGPIVPNRPQEENRLSDDELARNIYEMHNKFLSGEVKLASLELCPWCGGIGGYQEAEGAEPVACGRCNMDGVVKVDEVEAENVTKEDIEYRSWEREQWERAGYNADEMAGPELFSNTEWAEMMATHESRVAFGFELECGCRPGTCSYQYGGDCSKDNSESLYELSQWHAEVTEDPRSRRHTNPSGLVWWIRETPDGFAEYAVEGDDSRVYRCEGDTDSVIVLLSEETR